MASHLYKGSEVSNEPAGCSKVADQRIQRKRIGIPALSESLKHRRKVYNRVPPRPLTRSQSLESQDGLSKITISNPVAECNELWPPHETNSNQRQNVWDECATYNSSDHFDAVEGEVSKTEIMPPSEDAILDMPLYLDLTGSQSIIKIVPSSSSGSQSTYRAMLVKRSEAEDLNEVTKIRHEDLLGQIIGDIRSEPTVIAAERLLEIKSNVNSRPQMMSEPGQPAVPTAITGSTQSANEITAVQQIEQRFCGIGHAASSGADVASSTTPQVTNHFPRGANVAKQVVPPIFKPTLEEFRDPMAYFDKIMPVAAKFGVIKVVPPEGFKPRCDLDDNIRFRVVNQYLGRMFSRWTPAARELCTIKAYMASKGTHFTTAPLIDGLETNLPRLYHLVQRNGGVKSVIKKNRWKRIASEMPLSQNAAPKLAAIYIKYLQPYEVCSNDDRQKFLREVEQKWFRRHQRALDRAMKPLHRQRRVLGDSDSSEDEVEDEGHVTYALAEMEDCAVFGRKINLAHFKKIANQAIATHFRHYGLPSIDLLEEEYWRLVLLGTDHVCVNTAIIDTGEHRCGFSKLANDAYGRHPWNLKMLNHNTGNLLGALGQMPGVTVPELHVDMLYSTRCWRRDPHGLPQIHYLHSGPGKLWYGIPEEGSDKFRQAVERLCPTARQNKPVWLPPHTVMIPPNLLLEQQVSISKLTQLQGEYVIVFPKAYFCSISRGYTISESVYFATNSWLQIAYQAFQEMRESFEPPMFALELVLVTMARNFSTSLSVLQQVFNNLDPIVKEELKYRQLLVDRKITVVSAQSWVGPMSESRRTRKPTIREQNKCDICSCSLFFSKVWELLGKQSSLCLRHALRVLDKRKIKNAQNTIMVLFYSDHMVRSFTGDLEDRLSV